MDMKNRSDACDILRNLFPKSEICDNLWTGEDVKNVSEANLAFKRKYFDARKMVWKSYNKLLGLIHDQI